MLLAPDYRHFELPWDRDPREQRRLRRYVGVGLALFLVLAFSMKIADFLSLQKIQIVEISMESHVHLLRLDKMAHG